MKKWFFTSLASESSVALKSCTFSSSVFFLISRHHNFFQSWRKEQIAERNENFEVFQGNREVFQGNREVFQGDRKVFLGNREVFQGDRKVFQGNSKFSTGMRPSGLYLDIKNIFPQVPDPVFLLSGSVRTRIQNLTSLWKRNTDPSLASHYSWKLYVHNVFPSFPNYFSLPKKYVRLPFSKGKVFLPNLVHHAFQVHYLARCSVYMGVWGTQQWEVKMSPNVQQSSS